jgi:hypothetical protein
VGRGGALPGWAWRVRACDVMALPRKGPDIFAMMPGHACRTSSREHGDNRLTARHARCRVWGRLQGIEWLEWAKLQDAVLAPDGAAAAAAAAAAAPLLAGLSQRTAPAAPAAPACQIRAREPTATMAAMATTPPARARRSERTAARSFLVHPRLTRITQRLCHAILLLLSMCILPWTNAHHDVDSSCRALGQPRRMGGALHMSTRYLLLHPCRALPRCR